MRLATLAALPAAVCLAADPPCVPSAFQPASVASFIHGESPNLLSISGAEKVLVEASGERYALIWADAARAAVLLKPRPGAPDPLLVSFHRVTKAPGAVRCSAPDVSGVAHVRLPAIERLGTSVFLDAFQPGPAATRLEALAEVDLVGLRASSRVILFPREGDHPRSGSFFVTGGGEITYLLTGMSGGTWEIWCDGSLVEPGLPAEPGGTLQFEGKPGSYFLRRR